MRLLSAPRALAKATAGIILGLGFCASPLFADQFIVQSAAMDQPQINAFLRFDPLGAPQSFEGTVNIQAYLDTGAAGILLSDNTTSFLGVNRAVSATGAPIVFSDVGAVGTDIFGVSYQLHMSLAPFFPDADIDNPATYSTVYTQNIGPVRVQITPPSTDPTSVLNDLDVIGMPALTGKVMVMDPKPVNTFADTIRTSIHNPTITQSNGTVIRNPDIPLTSRHVKLSYCDSSIYTTTAPDPIDHPTMHANPFIGPNPLVSTPDTGTDPPKIKISYGGNSAYGSWLLDTGAAASMISSAQAAKLDIHVVLDPETNQTSVYYGGNPLPDYEQFSLPIGGVGGSKTLYGFYLDSLLLPTEEGTAEDKASNSPIGTSQKHLEYLSAPVLINDIVLHKEPVAGQPAPPPDVTIDGIFGMNFLVASARLTIDNLAGLISIPSIDYLTPGPFSMVTADFSDPNWGHLGLEPATIDSLRKNLTWAPSGPQYNQWADSFIFPVSSPNFADPQDNAAFFSYGDDVVFNGTAVFSGPDLIVVDLVTDVAPHSMIVDTSVSISPLYEVTVANYTFTSSNGSKITGLGGLLKTGLGTLTMETLNDYKGATHIMQGDLVLNVPQDIGDVVVENNTARLIMNSSQKFAALQITDGSATLAATTGNNSVKVLVTTDLFIAGLSLNPDLGLGPLVGSGNHDTGVLDLNNNAMVVHINPLDRDKSLNRFTRYIALARNTGSGTLWKVKTIDPLFGTETLTLASGLNSTAAADDSRHATTLGIMLNDDGHGNPIYDLFANEIVDINSILVKYTWVGDANLDGKVDATDKSILDYGFIHHLTRYQDGDFDFNGKIDADDYFLIDRGMLRQDSILGGAVRLAAVPEPTLLMLPMLTLAGLLRPRRPKQ